MAEDPRYHAPMPDSQLPEHPHPRAHLALLALLAAALLFGLWPGSAEWLTRTAQGALDFGEYGGHLSLWHGVNSALILSLFTIAGGVLLWRVTDPFIRVTGRFAPPIDGYRGFQLVHGRGGDADETGVAQYSVACGEVGFLLENVLVLGSEGGVLDLTDLRPLSGVADVLDLLLADVPGGLVRSHRSADQREAALDAGG